MRKARVEEEIKSLFSEVIRKRVKESPTFIHPPLITYVMEVFHNALTNVLALWLLSP